MNLQVELGKEMKFVEAEDRSRAICVQSVQSRIPKIPSLSINWKWIYLLLFYFLTRITAWNDYY
jgi:hypothetical protein